MLNVCCMYEDTVGEKHNLHTIQEKHEKLNRVQNRQIKCWFFLNARAATVEWKIANSSLIYERSSLITVGKKLFLNLVLPICKHLYLLPDRRGMKREWLDCEWLDYVGHFPEATWSVSGLVCDGQGCVTTLCSFLWCWVEQLPSQPRLHLEGCRNW